ncbi:MAG: hypothetical protein AAB425_12795 [Bdellovibrionota bacterium]
MRWVPILEYAVEKGVSISTLRRQIKSGRIRYRSDEGRYLVLDDGTPPQLGAGGRKHGAASLSSASLAGPTAESVEQLKRELARAREEVAELKTLIAVYEESLAPSPSPEPMSLQGRH